MTDLVQQLRELANPLREILTRKSKPAPNWWNDYKDNTDGRGDEFDYEVYDHGDTTVIYPVCPAAIEFLAATLPANCTRWGIHGYVLETERVNLVLNALQQVGLLSEEEYGTNLEIAEQQKQDGHYTDEER